MEESINNLKTAFAVGTSIMISEHFFSTFLSSPLTIETLYKEQKEKVYEYLAKAFLCGFVYGVAIDKILNNELPYATISNIAVSLIYFITYYKALE